MLIRQREQLVLLVLFQSEVSEQQHFKSAPSVCSQRPDRHHRTCKHLLSLSDPTHLPLIYNAAAQQEVQTLPGAEELQRQLQHSRQYTLKMSPSNRRSRTRQRCQWLRSLKSQSEKTKTLPSYSNMYCLVYTVVHIRLLLQCPLPKCSLCILLHVCIIACMRAICVGRMTLTDYSK